MRGKDEACKILGGIIINEQYLSGVFVMHYLQSLTPSLALGGELAYQRGPGVPGGQVAVVSAAGRYTNGDSTISGTLGTQDYRKAQLLCKCLRYRKMIANESIYP